MLMVGGCREEEAAALRKISSECFDGGVAIGEPGDCLIGGPRGSLHPGRATWAHVMCFGGWAVTSKYIGNELFTPHKTLRITVT